MQFRALLLRLVLFCGLLPFAATAQTATCVTASAGADDTICQGHCVTLQSFITGSNSTTAYTSSATPYAPFPFTGGNPVLVNLDDLWSPVITIPFCFEFYGSVYNQLIIGTNGLASFDVSQANGVCPWTIAASAPSTALPMNCIMAPFQDINPMLPTTQGATTINWQIYGTAPCRSFVINWNDVAMYGVGCGSQSATSQIVLHETTNIIDIFIADKSVCNSWNSGAAIEGLHDATGTQATIYGGRNYPTQWTVVNDGVRFLPSGPPNYSVQWSDPSGVISTQQSVQVCPTQTTTYTLQIVNNACSGNQLLASDQVNVVVVQSNLTVTDTAVMPLCNGSCNGSINVLASNGNPPYTYTWSPAITTGSSASNLCPGAYTCVVTDASGCPVPIAVSLTPIPTFTPSITTTGTPCGFAQGTASVTVAGGVPPFTYQWSTGSTSTSVSGLAAGVYQLIVSDSAGCPDTLGFVIQSTGMTATDQVTPLICAGSCNASVVLSTSGGTPPYSYSWTPYGGTSSTATNLCSGFFLCTITDALGCVTTHSVMINSPQPVVIAPSSNITICGGQSTNISAVVTGGVPPYTYTWNNNLPPNPTNLITPSQTTIYTVYATDANGCQSPAISTMVKVNPVPVAAFNSTPGTCPPAMVTFTNLTDSATSYFWDFGLPGGGDTSSLVSPSFTYTSGGSYVVSMIATNIYGCSDTLVAINGAVVPIGPTASISTDAPLVTTIDPTTIIQNLTTNANMYLVYFGDGDSLFTSSSGPYAHTYDSVGVYTVTLIAWSASGCSDTTSVTLIVEEATTCFIPNAFTPNNLGGNNLFMAYGVNVSDFNLLIFDRWGMLIYSSDDINAGWDGTFKGNKCQEDVYVWRLRYLDNSGNRHYRIGHVTLIR